MHGSIKKYTNEKLMNAFLHSFITFYLKYTNKKFILKNKKNKRNFNLIMDRLMPNEPISYSTFKIHNSLL